MFVVRYETRGSSEESYPLPPLLIALGLILVIDEYRECEGILSRCAVGWCWCLSSLLASSPAGRSVADTPRVSRSLSVKRSFMSSRPSMPSGPWSKTESGEIYVPSGFLSLTCAHANDVGLPPAGTIWTPTWQGDLWMLFSLEVYSRVS